MSGLEANSDRQAIDMQKTMAKDENDREDDDSGRQWKTNGGDVEEITCGGAVGESDDGQTYKEDDDAWRRWWGQTGDDEDDGEAPHSCWKRHLPMKNNAPKGYTVPPASGGYKAGLAVAVSGEETVQ